MSYLPKTIEDLNKYTPDRIKAMLIRTLENNKQLKDIINAVPCVMILVDRNGKVMFFNKFSVSFLSNPHIENQYIDTLIEDSNLSKKIKQAIFDDLQLVCEIVETPYFSNISHVICSVFSYVYEYKLNGWVVMIHDYTQQYAQRELEIRNSYLNSITQITTSIAHELRNPLGSISIHVQLLKKNLSQLTQSLQDKSMIKKKNTMFESIDVLQEELENLNNIISLFLNNLKVSPSEIKDCSLNVLLQDFIRFIEPDLKKHSIRYVTKLQEKLPHVLVSRPSITHVLLNIVKNSIEEMYDGGVITFRTYMKNNKVRLSIMDTGQGIAEEIQDTLFNPYITTKQHGTGIGLAIADKIMQLHHGSIKLDKSYKDGTILILEFPPYAGEHHLLEIQRDVDNIKEIDKVRVE